MTRILALDLGKRRTGVAYFDDAVGIPLPLATLVAAGDEELTRQIIALARERKVDRLLVGLPLLPSGAEGSQATWTRTIVRILTDCGYAVSLLDERYSTPRGKAADPDALAALNLLQTAIQRGI